MDKYKGNQLHYPLDRDLSMQWIRVIHLFNNWGLAPVVQRLDSAIQRINHYPEDKYKGNQLRYPLDRDLSMQWIVLIVLSTFSTTGAWPQFVQTLDGATQRINHHPVDKY